MRIVAALGLGALAGIVLTGSLTRACWKSPDPALLARLDSVLADQGRAAEVQDSLLEALDSVGRVASQVASAEQAARHARRVSDALADNLVEARTVRDSVVLLVDEVASLEGQRDALGAALTDQRLAVARLRAATADYTAATDSRISTLTASLRDAREALGNAHKPGRWSLGATAGYGAMVDAGAVRTGPALVAGVSYRVAF